MSTDMLEEETLKWPESLMLIRHVASAFQLFKKMMGADPLYLAFRAEYERDPSSVLCITMARELHQKYMPTVGDNNTPLAPGAEQQAIETGAALRTSNPLPDVIHVSPYDRTRKTLEALTKGWPELAGVLTLEDERIRERDHGYMLIYNNRRIFFALHPDQRLLYELEVEYYYRYPQGENIPDLRERERSWVVTLIREFSGKRVMAVLHHETILGLRANLERLDAKSFVGIDEGAKPINCGVTTYVGQRGQGRARQGKLVLETYNQKYYKD